MKRLLYLPILLFTIIVNGQPKTYLTDAFLRNDSLFATSNGVTTFKGRVNTVSAVKYINGAYVGVTSGNAVTNYGSWNIVIGDNAGDSLSGAIGNTFLNKDAGQSARTTRHCFYVGWDAGQFDKSGDHNFGAIEDALHFNVSGRDNIAIGRGALYSHTSPLNNVGIGYSSLYFQTQGTENTGVGAYSLNFLYKGYGVTALGAYAGEMNATAEGKTIFNSTYLGYQAGINGGFSRVTCLGYNTDPTEDNSFNYDNTIFGFNRGTINARVVVKGNLEVTGDITLNGVKYHIVNNPTIVGQVLTFTGNGNLEWK